MTKTLDYIINADAIKYRSNKIHKKTKIISILLNPSNGNTYRRLHLLHNWPSED